MRIDVLTIFPGMFQGPLTESLIHKAREKKLLDIRLSDIRSFTEDKHRSVDNRPFGGGPGMVMAPQPLVDALHASGVKARAAKPWPAHNRPLVVFMSPQGKKLDQPLAEKLAQYKQLVLICGRYEGIDERVMKWVHQEVSIGDFVLTGGELPAMVLIDCLARFVPGVVKEAGSVQQDSFYNGLLDHPHYTRPEVYKNLKVPKELLSGNHQLVQAWRREQSLKATYIKRPDLLKTANLSSADKEILIKIRTKK
jgi:tRNA (guanine37-N1)-methyltransferase